MYVASIPSCPSPLQVKLNKPLASWLVSDIDFYRKQQARYSAAPLPPPPREYKHKPGESFFPLEDLKRARCPALDIQLSNERIVTNRIAN